MHSLAYKTASSAIAAVLGAGVVLTVTALDGPRRPGGPALAVTPPAAARTASSRPGPAPARPPSPPGVTAGTRPSAAQGPVLADDVNSGSIAAQPASPPVPPAAPQPAATASTTPAAPVPVATTLQPSPQPSPSPACQVRVTLLTLNACLNAGIGG